MRDNVVAQWVASGLSVIAFIVLLKFGASYLPQGGPLGSVRAVIGSI